MWFIPTRGRPHALRKLRDAPGGLPPNEELVVIRTLDDPEFDNYCLYGVGGTQLLAPAGSRLPDIMKLIVERFPHEATYGLLSDDIEPQTQGWAAALDSACGPWGVSVADCAPRGLSIVGGLYVVGGELARAMGSLQPIEGSRHSFGDNAVADLARDFGLAVAVPGAKFVHRHVSFASAPDDPTYARARETYAEDEALYWAWHRGREASELYAKLRAALGVKTGIIDPARVKLVFALPIGGTGVDLGFHRSLIASLMLMRDRGIPCAVCESGLNSHVGKGRESVLWAAMREGATHIMFIDSDMVWDPELVLRLIAADHEFAGVPGRKKSESFELCLNKLPGEVTFHPRTGFVEVRDVGFAFVMLKRSCIEKLCEAYPELRYNAGPNAEWALFLDMIDQTDLGNGPYGDRLSEDLSFCRRWRACGGSVWLDPDARLGHVGRKEYVGALREVMVPAHARPALVAAE